MSQGSGTALGSQHEDKGLGLRFVNVQVQLALGILGNSASVRSQVSVGLGVIEVREVSGPAGWRFLGWPVVGNLLGLEGESEDILHVLLSGGWGLESTDDGHLTSLGLDGWVELVGDDGNVWDPVEGTQFDLSGGSGGVDVNGWGDGNNDGLIGPLADDDAHWDLGDKVGLDTAFNLALDVWDLQGDLGVTLESSNSINFGVELDFGSASADLGLSTEGQHDWNAELEAHGETHDGWEVHGLVGELDGLLVVEWNTALEGLVEWSVLEVLAVEVLVQVVNFPEALHAVADVNEDGTLRILLHLTGQDGLQDLLHVLILLARFLRAAASKLVGDLVNDLLEGAEVNGGFNGVDTNSARAEGKVVSEVDAGWQGRVAGAEPRELTEELGVQVLDLSGVEEVGGFAHVFVIQRLEERKDGASLDDHLLVKTSWSNFQLGKLVDGGVDEVVDILGGLEPGAHSQLLPDGDISVGAVDQHLDGGTTHNGMFSLVQSDGDEERKNLLLNDIIGDWVSLNTVDFILVFLSVHVSVSVLDWVVLFVRADEVLEGKDCLGLLLDIVGIVQDLLDNLDHFWMANVS